MNSTHVKNELRSIKLSELKSHKAKQNIYNNSDVSELIESIKSVGLQQKIVINKSLEILIGDRRYQALNALGIDEIEVEVVDIPKDEELYFIVCSNQQRVKSYTEIYNELKVLKSHWGKKKGTRTDLSNDLSDEEKLHTRARIAKKINVPESTLQKIESIGDKDLNTLKLLDLQEKEEKKSLNQVYKELLKADDDDEVEDESEIDLTEIKVCSYCGCVPKEIELDENNKLKFKED